MTAFAHHLEVGDEVFDEPTWDEIAQAISELKSNPSREVMLEGGEDAVLIISYAPPFGFFVVARQDDENGESQLVDETLGKQVVEAVIARQAEVTPRCTLVDEQAALKVAEEFYRTGQRAGEHSWRPPFRPSEIEELAAQDGTSSA